MKTNRLEAFSDGVLAIIITIMVLEMKIPEGTSFDVLQKILPVFLSYILSFIYIGIYWNNHHHLLQVVNNVNGTILWANLNLLFWLSLFPFVTGWMGENHFVANPTLLYGVVLLMAAIAFKLLVHAVINNEGKDSRLAKIYQHDWKLLTSIVMYIVGIIASYFEPYLSIALYLSVAVLWIIPDKRIEKNIKTTS